MKIQVAKKLDSGKKEQVVMIFSNGGSDVAAIRQDSKENLALSFFGFESNLRKDSLIEITHTHDTKLMNFTNRPSWRPE